MTRTEIRETRADLVKWGNRAAPACWSTRGHGHHPHGGVGMAERICSAPDCNKLLTRKDARGVCPKHYYRVRRYGTPELPARLTPEQRFWAKVDKQGPVPSHRPELGPCWVWTGATAFHGYGHVRRGSTDLTAHRYAWELTHGAVTDGLHVLHHCDNPPCCNPHHLFLGTHGDNMADMDAKGRRRSVPHNKGGRPGTRHANAKLTDEAVREIRRRHSNGEHSRDLEVEFGVSRGTLNKVVRGAAWRHVQ